MSNKNINITGETQKHFFQLNALPLKYSFRFKFALFRTFYLCFFVFLRKVLVLVIFIWNTFYIKLFSIILFSSKYVNLNVVYCFAVTYNTRFKMFCF